MGVVIFIAIVIAAIRFFPRVAITVAFTYISFQIVEDGLFFRALPGALIFSAIFILVSQLSPETGGIRSLKSHKPFDLVDVLVHIIISSVCFVVCLIVMSLISLFLRHHGGTIGFLLILGLNPLAGFFVATLTNNSAEFIWGTDEDIEEGFRQKKYEAERKKQEEEQRRIAAEREAEQQRIAAEQQRIAAEREAERQRIAAEQEAKRKAEEAKKAAAEEAERQRVKEERKRAISNQKAVKDFRDRLAKDYDVDFTFLKNLPTASASSFQEELSEDEAVWARNDERFEAIEKLIRSTGFSPEELQPPRFPYESAFLEYVFSLDSPIAQCADKYNRFEGIRIKNKVLPAAYLIDTMMAIDRAIAGLGEYYKRGIDIYREDYNIMKAGLRGEWAVQDILDMHAGAFLVIHDLRMEFPGRGDRVDSVEIDTLVLAPNGIFAVEVKNYGASGRYKIIVTGDGNWYKEYPPRWDDDTPKREVMSNPFAQNDRHVAFLERFINELLGRGMADWVHVENIICIANDQVTLETDPSAKQTLTRVSNLYNQLTHDRTQKLTVEELEKIKAALKSKSLPGKKYPVPDYSKQMSWAAEWYRYLIETSDHIIDAARRCATDHPEFFTRIQ